MEIIPADAINLKDYSPKILQGKAWRVTEKIDGVRRLFYKSPTGRVYAYSSTGKFDPWLSHITKTLENPKYPCDFAYDTELVDRDSLLNRVESFQLRTITNSKASQEYPDNKKDLMAICFDLFPPGREMIGHDRDILLRELFSELPMSSPIVMVPIMGVILEEYVEKIKEFMSEIARFNGEGIMLMDLDSIYIPGRSKALIKVKRLQEFVGTIVDAEMGSKGSKIEGGVSALICNVPQCSLPVRVGSGLTLADRRKITENFEKFLGGKIEIEAFGVTRNSRNSTSLSHPVFKRFI